MEIWSATVSRLFVCTSASASLATHLSVLQYITVHDLYVCLLPQCKVLRTHYPGFPIGTV